MRTFNLDRPNPTKDFRRAMLVLLDEHRPSRMPFFRRVASLPSGLPATPICSEKIYLVYQAAMHATRAAAYYVPYLDSPALRTRKLRILMDDDRLTGEDSEISVLICHLPMKNSAATRIYAVTSIMKRLTSCMWRSGSIADPRDPGVPRCYRSIGCGRLLKSPGTMQLTGISDVVVQGFTVANAPFEGILATNAANVTIVENHVTSKNRNLVVPTTPTCCPFIPAWETSYANADLRQCGDRQPDHRKWAAGGGDARSGTEAGASRQARAGSPFPTDCTGNSNTVAADMILRSIA